MVEARQGFVQPRRFPPVLIAPKQISPVECCSNEVDCENWELDSGSHIQETVGVN